MWHHIDWIFGRNCVCAPLKDSAIKILLFAITHVGPLGAHLALCFCPWFSCAHMN